MATATRSTKRRNVLAELDELERVRREAHEAVSEVKQLQDEREASIAAKRKQLTAWRRERPAEWEENANPLPLPKTDSAKLREEVRKLMAEPDPHEEDYAAAVAEFHAADLAVRRFRVERVRDILEARVGERRKSAAADLAEGERLVESASRELQDISREIVGVITTTPGLERGAVPVELDDNPAWPKARSIEAEDGEWAPHAPDLESEHPRWRRVA